MKTTSMPFGADAEEAGSVGDADLDVLTAGGTVQARLDDLHPIHD